MTNDCERADRGVLSRSTVHRSLQDVVQKMLDEESERWEARRAWRGHREGRHRADILYTEADGVSHLQREDRTLKTA